MILAVETSFESVVLLWAFECLFCLNVCLRQFGESSGDVPHARKSSVVFVSERNKIRGWMKMEKGPTSRSSCLNNSSKNVLTSDIQLSLHFWKSFMLLTGTQIFPRVPKDSWNTYRHVEETSWTSASFLQTKATNHYFFLDTGTCNLWLFVSLEHVIHKFNLQSSNLIIILLDKVLLMLMLWSIKFYVTQHISVNKVAGYLACQREKLEYPHVRTKTTLREHYPFKWST